jgi:hypothetical protein
MGGTHSSVFRKKWFTSNSKMMNTGKKHCRDWVQQRRRVCRCIDWGLKALPSRLSSHGCGGHRRETSAGSVLVPAGGAWAS